MEDSNYYFGVENTCIGLLESSQQPPPVDLLGSLHVADAHATSDQTVTLQPTSILKPSQRENKPRVDVDRRKVTFCEDLAKTSSGNGEESKWGIIRELDELENWSERNQVVTKADHVTNRDCSRLILLEVLDNLPCFWKEDGMEQTTDEQQEDDFSEEEFRPATEVFAPGRDPSNFELDFLESLGTDVDPSAIALARQSLYVKFDPLVKGISPEVASALALQSNASFKGGDDLLQLDTPEKTTSTTQPSKKQLSVSSQPESKQAIPSALPHRPADDIKAASPLACTSNCLIGSLQFQEQLPVGEITGPPQGVDELLFGSPSVPPNDVIAAPPDKQKAVEPESGLVDVLMYTQQDIEEKVRAAMEECQRQFEQEMTVLLSATTQKEEELERLRKECADIQRVASEYERLLNQQRDCSEERLSAIKEARRERDQALTDFNSVEMAFADQHKRYEKLKVLYDKAKRECADTNKLVAEYHGKLTRSEQKCKSLKAQAEEKLASSNAEIERLNKMKTSEINALQADLKKEAVRVAALERQLQQKMKEAQELSSICEDLMKAMGRSQ